MVKEFWEERKKYIIGMVIMILVLLALLTYFNYRKRKEQKDNERKMRPLFINKIPASEQEMFTEKLLLIADRRGLDENGLMFVMDTESGLNPRAKNPISGAVGLLQWLPSTLAGMGLTPQDVLNKTATEQLDIVDKYLSNYSFEHWYDIYLAVFYPYAIGENNSYTFGIEKNTARAELIAKQNPIFDLNKDNKITKGEFIEYLKKRVNTIVPVEYKSYFK